MQREVWEMRERRWAGVREISPRHHFSLTSLRPIFLSSSILDDNIVLIWIPKTLSDMGLPSCWERLKILTIIDQTQRRGHDSIAVLHLPFILLLAPFFHLMRPHYWFEYLISGLELVVVVVDGWGGGAGGGCTVWLVMEVAVALDGRLCLLLHINCLCTFPNDTDFN